MKYYTETELVLNSKKQVYHLGLSANNLAHKIILVGDQDRVSMVSEFFEKIEHKSQHREFVCHTGIYKGKRISAISTGIGTDNIDITINELDALVNIDLDNRIENEEKISLEIIRIGTCGILQENIPVHSYILSSHACGFDNVAHFYKINFSAFELDLAQKINNFLDFPKSIQTYFSSANEDLVSRLSSKDTHIGITVTSSGFYGPQGRTLRIPTHTQDIHLLLAKFIEKDLKILNFEMESSALFALGKELGHRCATICLGIANRPNLEFSSDSKAEMQKLIAYTLERI
ncbi:MAG: phosphorylase [Crocinitomicaceae bacterium]|nr:phosphorylase [Crocinitomicaceae bacterium]NDC93424.1 phosphorylase [Flavobacteriales bacterium]